MTWTSSSPLNNRGRYQLSGARFRVRRILFIERVFILIRLCCYQHVQSAGHHIRIIKAAYDQILADARRSLVVLGGGAQDASTEAGAFVERLGAVTVTTINGKGILPPEHPLCLGSTLPQAPVLEELKSADVVLAVGTELAETDTLLFDGRLEIGGQLIRVDIEPDQFGRNILPEVAILTCLGGFDHIRTFERGCFTAEFR